MMNRPGLGFDHLVEMHDMVETQPVAAGHAVALDHSEDMLDMVWRSTAEGLSPIAAHPPVRQGADD
jgi:hypothetical protein